MQTTRLVQAVVLIVIVAIAASCAASKEYTSKLFTPRIPVAKDSQGTVALRFLEIDSSRSEEDGWVTTDIIMGRDTVSKTLALDNFVKNYPASPVAADSSRKGTATKTTAVAASKPLPEESEPVAKNINPGEVRTKKTREQ